MAKRKRTRKGPARKRAGLSAKVKTRRRKSRRGSSKMGLSEAFSPAAATHTGKGMLKGAIVGYGVASLEPLIDSLPSWGGHAILLGGSFISGTVLKMDGISQSLATIWGYRLAHQMQGMGEDGDWTDPNALSEEVEYMDEDGNEMVLADDGNLYYLEEMYENEMCEDDELSERMVLADGGARLPYPEYVNQDMD